MNTPSLILTGLFLTLSLQGPDLSDFEGVLEGEGVRVEWRVEANELKGTLEFQGNRYPAKGQADERGIKGTFVVEQSSFPFSIQKRGAAFELESGGVRYSLTSSGAPGVKNPLAGRGAKKAPLDDPPSSEEKEPALKEGYQRYRHPLGTSFQYPKGWRLQEIPGAMALIPPDAKIGFNGPEEAYLVMAAPSQGVKRTDDSRLAQYLDQAIQQQAPFLRRTQAPKSQPCRKMTGSMYVWEGASPLGFHARAESRVVVIDGLVASLFALARTETLARHRAVLDTVFQTFWKGKPETDPALVGQWRSENFHRVSSGTGTLGLANHQTMILKADGTLWNQSQTAFNGDTRIGGQRGGSYTGEAGSAAHGQWAASKGRLYLLWPDGNFGAFSVYVQGSPGRKELLLTPLGGGEKQLWTQ